MKGKLIVFLFNLFCISASAQINVFLNPLQGLELRPSDIFKASVQNTSQGTVKVYLKGIITNRSTGQQIVTATSQIFDVPPGLKTISEPQLSPHYSISSSITSQTGVLPYGEYRVCVQVIKAGMIEEVGNDCQETSIIPTSPPLLLSPENQSAVTEQYPLLVWLPPMPIGKNKIVYDLKLVEMMQNQPPYDAVTRNFALVEKGNLSATSLQYPSNAMQLEIGKKYAWRIVAKTQEGNLIGETEVWWFTKESTIDAKAKKPEEQKVSDNYFIVMDDDANKGKIIVKEHLKIVSPDYAHTSEIVYKIVDQQGNQVSKNDVVVTSEGSGKFIFTFTNPRKLYDNTYKLVVTSTKRREKYIVFTFLKSQP